MRSLCSEFPCDNPSLHFGGTWVLLDTTGTAAFEANADEPPPAAVTFEVASLDSFLDEVACEEPSVVEAHVLEGADREEVMASAPSVEADVEEREPEVRESGVFLASDAEEVEPTLPITLTAPAMDEPPQAETSNDAHDDVNAFCMLLEEVAGQFGGESAAEVVSSWLRDEDSPLAEERAPWLALLRGDECDLASASAATLDEWASKMLAKAIGRDAGELRRELRSRGLAAYGLLAA